MREDLLELLEVYLTAEADIDAIDSWIAANVWDAGEDDKHLIDEVAVELAYLSDGNSDEAHFRRRVAEILRPTSDVSSGYERLERMGLGGHGVRLRFSVPSPIIIWATAAPVASPAGR